MAEYYVVRDKNTGLYFRGKGVNRWGKYYNQASIYRIKANAENTIKEVSWRGEQAEIVPIQIVETTADVVPKSEVERLSHKCDECAGCTQWKCDCANIELEVAREIFEDIEKRISSMEYKANTPRKTIKVEELKEQVDWVLHEVVPQTITELKKKYTESEGKG